MPQPSQGPRPEDLHITPRGWATKSMETATAFKEWVEARGVPVSISENGEWIVIRPEDYDAVRRLPPLAEKEFGRTYRVGVWMWYFRVYNPDNDSFGGGVAVAAREGVVASAEA